MVNLNPMGNQYDSKYPSKVWLASKDAAKYLHISESTLNKMCFNNEIPYYKKPNGRLRYFLKSDLDAYMEQFVRVDTRAEIMAKNSLKST